MRTLTKTETLNFDILQAMGVEYSAQFVPFSRSRNKDDKNPSLNWVVTLKRNGVEITTDYMQGCGHVPIGKLPKGSERWRRMLKDEIIERACETRELFKVSTGYDGHRLVPTGFRTLLKKKFVTEPGLKSVLWSLVLDSDVLECESFEEWANNFGYEEDSISAEKIYQACLKIALKVNRMFTRDELEQLREFYQDY